MSTRTWEQSYPFAGMLAAALLAYLWHEATALVVALAVLLTAAGFAQAAFVYLVLLTLLAHNQHPNVARLATSKKATAALVGYAHDAIALGLLLGMVSGMEVLLVAAGSPEMLTVSVCATWAGAALSLYRAAGPMLKLFEQPYGEDE